MRNTSAWGSPDQWPRQDGNSKKKFVWHGTHIGTKRMLITPGTETSTTGSPTAPTTVRAPHTFGYRTRPSMRVPLASAQRRHCTWRPPCWPCPQHRHITCSPGTASTHRYNLQHLQRCGGAWLHSHNDGNRYGPHIRRISPGGGGHGIKARPQPHEVQTQCGKDVINP